MESLLDNIYFDDDSKLPENTRTTAPGYNLASVFIFQWANYGYIGLASATTLKLIVIVGTSLAIIQGLSKWTGLSAAARRGV